MAITHIRGATAKSRTGRASKVSCAAAEDITGAHTKM